MGLELGFSQWHLVPDKRQRAQTRTQDVPSEYQELLLSVWVMKHWHKLPMVRDEKRDGEASVLGDA